MKYGKFGKSFFSILCILMLALSSFSIPALAEGEIDLSEYYKKKDVETSWSEAGATVIDLSTLSESLVITSAGDYVLSGETAFPVLIQAGTEDDVRLILNGVTISSASGPAIREISSDKLIVTLAEGTVNTLSIETAVTDGEDTLSAALYAENDLSVNGSGTLTVVSSAGHGIQSKADLIIAGGILQVTAAKDAIRGRNSVLIMDGTLTLSSQGDGITSTRDDKEGKGWILIAGGSITLTAGEGAGDDISLSEGGWGMGGFDQAFGGSESSDAASQKGIKAATDLTVCGGEIILDCADDGLHAANITVSRGSLTIRSGDDGMHADATLLLSGGSVNIPRCHEGLEGYTITISGGEITIVSDDDGINAAGGTDSSGTAGTWGRMDNFASSEANNGSVLTISGGTVSLSAGNDGLDSNGSIVLSGGVVGIWTATNEMDGALDFNGSGTMTGGTLIIANSAAGGSMASMLSGQSHMYVSLDSAASAGTEITVLDGSSQVLGSFTPQASFSSVIIASSALAEGAEFSLLAGGQTVYSGTLTANVSASGMGFGGMGGFGGGMGGPGSFGGSTDGTMPEGTPPTDAGQGGPGGSFNGTMPEGTPPTGAGQGGPGGFGGGRR